VLLTLQVILNILDDFEEVIFHEELEVGVGDGRFGEEVFVDGVYFKISKAHMIQLQFRNRFDSVQFPVNLFADVLGAGNLGC
jgi:hypothetical protein